MSNILIRLLIVEYLIILVVCLFERNYMRALYWLGAAIIVYATIGIK